MRRNHHDLIVVEQGARVRLTSQSALQVHPSPQQEAAQLQISPDDAARRFDETQAQLTAARDQAVQTAKVAADEAASAASKAAFLAFAALLLGGAAAAIGGSMAVQRRAAFAAPTVRSRSV